MPEDRVSITCAFGNPRKMNSPAILQVQVHIGIWESRTSRANVVWVIGPWTEGSALGNPRTIRPRQRQWHDVGDEKVTLAEHKHPRVQIDLKFINRRNVANRWLDQKNGTLEFDVIRLNIDGREYQKRVGTVPDRRGIT